jgi:peptidoglycan/LPS O-acetylase OafA/YrhL
MPLSARSSASGDRAALFPPPPHGADGVYRPEIDGLRAVAVLSVVLHHAVPAWLPGGFIGVDVFFVISGYLITQLLVGEWRRHGRIDLAQFYARRVRRLMPALWVVVVAVLVASALLVAPIGGLMFRISDSAVASLVFAANFYFLGNTGGYFDGAVDELPLLHLWSLAVEEQYYLLFPLLIWALLARGGRWPVAALALLGLFSLLLAEHWLQVDPRQAFFQMPARFWELVAGALIVFLPMGRIPGRWVSGLSLVGLAGIAVACFTTEGGSQFPGLGALPAVAGATAVLLAIHGSSRPGGAGPLLRSRPAVAIGLVSYSFYLWHWPLLALDRAVTLDDSPHHWRLALCALALVLAWLSYRFVELPVRRMRGIDARRTLLAAAGVTALLLVVCVQFGRWHITPGELAERVERAREDQPANMKECHFGQSTQIERLKPESCHSRPGGTPSVAVWGDSHALAWQPFAWRLAEARGEAASSLTMDACPPVDGFTGHNGDQPRFGENCARFNALALDELASGRYRTVVMASRWAVLLPSIVEGLEPAPSRPGDRLMAPEALQSALAAALDRLSGVPEIILMGPPSELRHSAPICIASGREHQCEMTRAQHDARVARAMAVLRAVAAGRGNVRVVDPSDFFCDQARCPVDRYGYSMFWDDDHVSSTAARAFAEAYLADPARYTPPSD